MLLSNTNNEANKEKLNSLINKEVYCMVTGQLVKGVVKEVTEDKFSLILTIKHEPVNWGGDIFTNAYISARKGDNFGGMKYVAPVTETNEVLFNELKIVRSGDTWNGKRYDEIIKIISDSF